MAFFLNEDWVKDLYFMNALLLFHKTVVKQQQQNKQTQKVQCKTSRNSSGDLQLPHTQMGAAGQWCTDIWHFPGGLGKFLYPEGSRTRSSFPLLGGKLSWNLRKMLTGHQFYTYCMFSRNKYHSIVLFPVQHFANLWVSRKNFSSSQVTMLLEVACWVWQVGLPSDPEVWFV